MDLKFKPYFLHYRKESQCQWEIFHAHKGMEFMFVHEGNGRIFLEREVLEVLPGTLLCFHPFQLHRLVMEQHVPFIRTILLFDHALLDPYLRILPQLHAFFRRFKITACFTV
jgi:hypothetical protein